MSIVLLILLRVAQIYLALSLIYFLATFQENVFYVRFHAKDKAWHKKAKMLLSNMLVSIVFGGVILVQKAYKAVQLSYKKFKAWYQLARMMKQITKGLKDVPEKQKRKS
jgi:hypothetical protein